MSVENPLSAGSGTGPALGDVETVLAAGTAHMAHRGNGHTHLDNSLEGFESAIQSGHNMLDGGDLWYGNDGSLLNFHNGTATGELAVNALQFNGQVASLGVSGFRALKQRVAADNAVYANLGDERTCTFEDLCALVRRYGHVIITPEIKTAGATAMAKLIATVQKYGLDKSVIVQSFIAADLLAAHQAGLKTAWLQSSWSGTPLATAQANGVDFFAYDFTNASFTPANLQSLYDAGIRLAPWTFDRASQVAAEAARVGRPLAWVASNYGTYTGGVVPAGKNDPFGSMVPFRGQIPSGGNRGVFTSPGKLSIVNSAYVLQGWGSQPAPFASLTVKVTYETIGVSTTLGAVVHFGMATDESAQNNNIPQGGYQLEIHPNGTATIRRYLGTTGVSVTGTITLAAGTYVAGGSNTWKIEFLGTTVKLTCVETGQTTSGVDNTYRGGVFFFGNSASDCEVSFSGVAIT